MRVSCLAGMCLLVVAAFGGCGSSWIDGNAIKSPVAGAEIVVTGFDSVGSEVALSPTASPVVTDSGGGYTFGLDPDSVGSWVNRPLIVGTIGGVMGDPPATAPMLEAIIASPSALTRPEVTVTAHLSLASSVAAGLLRKQTQGAGRPPSVAEAEAIIALVESTFDVDLHADPADPAQAVALLNQCVDQNLDLVATPTNNPAVDELIAYLVANMSSSSGVLDGMMDDPASPGTDCPAAFSPFKTGMLTTLLPGGPSAFMNLGFSTDTQFIENNGMDYACLTATLTDAEGSLLAAVDDVTIAIVSGTGTLDPALVDPGPGGKRLQLTSTTVGNVVVRASYDLTNGNTISHDLTVGVVDLHVDTDGDGFTDGEETMGWDIIVDENGYGNGADPGLLTSRHVTSDPNRPDTDMDGLSDYEEYLIQCDPQRVDTDGDGLSDYEEWTQWMTSPCSVDSDGDCRGPDQDHAPSALLFDGNEVNLNDTSPSLDDTDGDGWTDYEEVDHPARSPLVADLPELSLMIVDTVDVRLDVEYAEQTGFERQYGSEFTESHTETEGRSSQHSVTTSLEVGYESSDSLCSWGTWAVKLGFAYGYTWGTSTQTSDTSQRAYQDYITDSRVYTETAASGSMTMGVQLENTGDTAFTLTHLAFAARHWNPGANAGAKASTGSFSTLATLTPQLGGGIALAPGQFTPVIQVQASDVNASRIKDFLAQPASLHIEPASYELENAAGLNFAYLEEITKYRTARVIIDFGDGRTEDYRVATNAKRGPGGTYPGVTLGGIMNDILGISYAATGQAPTSVRDVANYSGTPTNADAEGFWVVVVSSDRPEPVGVDFDDIVLQAADQILMMFVRDDDGDGLYSPEEQHYRTDDTVTDQDGDGLTDAEEVRGTYVDSTGTVREGGWDVTVFGSDTYRVFSDPTAVDQDGDGFRDDEEKAAGTDPTLADTDGDGLPDLNDPHPLHPAGILFVRSGESGSGSSWAGAFGDLQAALAAASSRNSDKAGPDNDVSGIWVAKGIYKPTSGADRGAHFDLPAAVGVYGGFEGVDTETKLGHRNPDPITNGTVLSGDLAGDDETGGSMADNSMWVVNVPGGMDNTTVLDGFLITGGNGSIAAGMYVEDSGPTLRNLFFRKNTAAQAGGGLCIINGSGMTLTNCTFSDNEAIQDGGGLYIHETTAPTDVITLSDCVFSENRANIGGGLYYNGVESEQRSLELDGCAFLQNQASGSAGGAYLSNGIHRITNTQFRQNAGNGICAVGSAQMVLQQSAWWKNSAGGSGAGVYLGNTARAWVVHCTFLENSSWGGSTTGGGMRCDEDTRASVENSIFWGNTATWHGLDTTSYQYYRYRTGGRLWDVSMSCVEGVRSPGYLEGYWNTGGDPKFVDAENGDLRIGADSSCIDTGRTLVDFDPLEPGFQPLPETDLGGQPRIVDGDGDGWVAVDMGAHEYQGN
ncbi:MAG: right-handed parallel beta-helix repeat-containing protein [bacterium]|nr:right-handed parallel beta-helix repeat-containing protein [bacterium]